MAGRFGFDAPRELPIEESIAWAAANDIWYIDFNADNPPNDIASFDEARATGVRELLAETGVQLGVHPVSAIENAEYVPIMAEAVDAYLAANVRLAAAGSSPTAAINSAMWSCADGLRWSGSAGWPIWPRRPA